MPQIFVNGFNLHVVTQGDGPPLLFVHGYPLDHSMWSAQIDYFAKSHTVIAPDLRGFGKSDVVDGPVTMQTYADDLAALLDAMNITDPVHFCSLSMGGYVGWAFEERHRSRLASLILCDTRATADNAAAQKTRELTALRALQEGSDFLASDLIDKLFVKSTREQRPEVIEQTKQVIRSTDPRTIAASSRAMAARPDVSERLPSIDLRTLIIVGDHDAISPPSEMRDIANAMANATYVEVEDAGHMSPLERPEPVNAAIEHFLNS